ncbi:transposase, partial [Kitasatospora sp. NPDC001574]
MPVHPAATVDAPPPHLATVAGVPVDTRHWIGGRRVASADTFADHSPVDGTEHTSHKAQGSMIRRYIIWRNKHAA